MNNEKAAKTEPHKMEATVFVYRHKRTRRTQAHYIEVARILEDDPEWEHLATLEPRMWIEHNYDAAEQRDELLVKVAAWEQKAANWMASPEAAQRLDGYRDLAQRLNIAEQQRDELLAAAEAIEINAEECLDFDECTAMLVQIDDYHKLMEAIA